MVTGNHVVDRDPVRESAIWSDLIRRAETLDAQRAAPAPGAWRRPAVLLTAGVALTVLLALLGGQQWQLPGRGPAGVTDVPQSLLTFLLLCAALCAWTGGRLVRPAALLGPAAARLWWVLVAGAALVSVAGALSLASYAGTGERPADLLVRCAVPVVPAVLAGFLARDAGRGARVQLALGTGLVTVPLGALGWALLASTGRATAGVGDVLGMTVLSSVAPLLLAVTFVAADRRGRRAR